MNHNKDRNNAKQVITTKRSANTIFQKPKIRKTLVEMYRSVDLDGIIIDCNESYASKLGYTVDEVIGTLLFKHTPKENLSQIKDSFETWKNTGKATKRKVKLMTKAGETFDVLLNATNRYDNEGALVGSNTTMLELSEIKMLQELVKIRKYESLYENSPDLYRTVNYMGIIVDCNKSYQNKLGYTKEEIIGSNLLEHTATRSISTMRINMADWRKTGSDKTSEVWLKKKDGTEFPVILTPTNLYDDDGQLIGRNVILKDATELHSAKKELTEREKIDKLKEEFLSVVTHELKSPLTPIIGFSQALSRHGMLGELNEKQTEAVNTILINARKLRRIIDDLLDAHKLELGKMRFDNKKINVNELIASISSSFSYTAKAKNISIDYHRDQKNTVITSDRDRIEQVITNLLYNAVDFVSKDTGRISVFVERAPDDASFVTFTVQDNGIGIPKEKQKQLFSKFYQADTSRTRKHGGTGLGLSICRAIVKKLGGQIRVESAKEQGTKFYFTIPISRENYISSNNDKTQKGQKRT